MVFTPRPPRYGECHVPPAVWRKYEQLRELMDGEPTARKRYQIYELQMSLGRSGYEVPTTASDFAGILERLEERVMHFGKGV